MAIEVTVGIKTIKGKTNWKKWAALGVSVFFSVLLVLLTHGLGLLVVIPLWGMKLGIGLGVGGAAGGFGFFLASESKIIYEKDEDGNYQKIQPPGNHSPLRPEQIKTHDKKTSCNLFSFFNRKRTFVSDNNLRIDESKYIQANDPLLSDDPPMNNFTP